MSFIDCLRHFASRSPDIKRLWIKKGVLAGLCRTGMAGYGGLRCWRNCLASYVCQSPFILFLFLLH